MTVKFPIVLDRIEYCTVCNHRLVPEAQKRPTVHRVTIYPDVEYHRCLECTTPRTVRFDREAIELVSTEPADAAELHRIDEQLNALAGEIATRRWGKLGLKDQQFIERVHTTILGLRTRIAKLIR